ncbi:carboxypeptidase-like regulatory domain-containing protein [Bacteroides helcogenes]|uniref:TonB-dependent receptor n=1 Tax=Bacteroides helcogenes (strain ATCC 35417 / DSM 20613 / JCM 6297 / CCUG 15421 / P 36-108) TaxID=693979 RepID=E6SWD5_BACT6|nr:carboxypeptidase-like regulatory domain-containing protein [Bacteroides helcogenes]ADV44596.1 TonB-dependent receptor [Bacteroides helcogenes P 36-108]MDY5238885.1 carboxypeptidase-like regulatory domain-containing protein [Bacteroides helcogenes]
MRRHLIHFLLAAVLSAFSAVAFAQTAVKGQLVDAETGEPLVGAAVMVEGTAQGVVTDIDGYFKQSVAQNATLLFKYVGYKDLKKKIAPKGTSVDLGVIKMEPDAVMLNDVVITSSIAVARKTPVALSTIDPVFIEEKLGTQEFPEILKSTPGVYATKNGGGYGDSKINMRGFQSANVAVMVNGVPMNDMEWGGLYWSNWAGLGDVTRSMQTQRGLGASKVSSPSVGGTINIVTRTTDQKKGGSVSYGIGNDGYNQLSFSVSTGLSKSGWNMTLLGGKKWGDGYIQGTEFEGYNYFLSISKQFGDSHTLSLTAFGAPQWHNQRSNYDGLTVEGWQQVKKYMGDNSVYRYNPTYGFGKNGERKTSARNVYHKPQISLNHQWQINNKSSLSTAAYVSIGRGYGNSGQGTSAYSSKWYGSSNGVLNMDFRNADGTFAYDQIQDLNEQSTQGSLMVMSKSKNFHNWYGLLSTYTTKINENIDFYGGIDFRYYKGVHTNEITDLYNGEYYIDRYRANVKAANYSGAGTDAFKNKKLNVGDVVYRDYDGYVMQEGVFFQAEYNKDKLAAFVAGSLSNTGYWRYDRFYYDADHAKSETVNFMGFTAKGGVNYNLTENHNVFANVGFISRAPFFSGGAFLNSTVSNETNPDAINEKIFSAEIGYGFRSRYFTANVNAYFTKWMDKTTAKTGDYTNSNGAADRYMLNMSGVDAKHMGVELDFVAKPAKWLDINGMLSVGDWKWDSDATGYFYNSGGQPLADLKGTIASGIQADDHTKFTLQQKGVKVGGSAQLTAALGAKFKISKDLGMGLDYTYYGNNYADYSLQQKDITASSLYATPNPWKIPGAGQLDLSANYRFNIGNCKATLFGNVENLLNYEYIMDAYEGGTSNWDSAYRVFYSFGRTYSIRLKVNF